VTWTNSRGGSGTATGTTSWSASGIALQSGSNVITVTARDAAGNSGTDMLAVTYSPSDTIPPIISAVSAGVSANGATISWTTDKPADSQVDYGKSTSYGSSTQEDAGLLTSHVQSVTGLAADTVYHFRVRSKDSAGNLAVSPDLMFRTSAGVKTTLILYYPDIPSRLSGINAAQNSDQYTGIALSNLDGGDATLIFTAYDASGALLSGAGITNPVTRVLRPGEQMPILDVQLFGNTSTAGPPGWIQVDSSTAKVCGFFMTFDNGLSLLDGAEISSRLLTSLVLPELTGADFTKILIANPNAGAASVRLDLVKADGSIRSSVQENLIGNSTFSADLYREIFPGTAADPTDYLRMDSTAGVLALETLGKVSRDFAVLAGQDRTGGASRLYSPQYAVGGPWQSTLSIVNLDSNSGTIAMKLVADNGSQIGPTRFADISGGGKLFVSDQAFFSDSALQNPDQILQGYVEITGIGLHLTGSVVFGDAKRGIFTSALPLVSALWNTAVFSHIASDETYFTGLAILNPNDVDATATIELHGSDGELVGSVNQALSPHSRVSRLLTEYFPVLVGQKWTSGYFKVKVDHGAACFALFGTNDLTVLSAIPPEQEP
jgi:hypothetical protein